MLEFWQCPQHMMFWITAPALTRSTSLHHSTYLHASIIEWAYDLIQQVLCMLVKELSAMAAQSAEDLYRLSST